MEGKKAEEEVQMTGHGNPACRQDFYIPCHAAIAM
jgi:hypothetical protein